MLWVVAVAALATAGLPAWAQEKEKPETAPVPEKEKPAEEAPPGPSGCSFKILWAEQEVPIQRLVPREVIKVDKVPTLEVAYREEKRIAVEMVLKSREVEHEVPCTVVTEVKVTDPVTGVCSTVLQPCTTVKKVKDVEYYSVAEERPITVLVPYLKAAETEVVQKSILLEELTIMQKDGWPVRIAAEAPRCDQWYLVPKPPCPSFYPAPEEKKEKEKEVAPPPRKD
jgi:hypothetical protein